MTEVDLFQETIEKFFSKNTTKAQRREAEEPGGWLAQVWDQAADLGLPWISIPEAKGGTGGSLADLGELLYAVGKFAVPLPLAETAMLGGWLAATVGLGLSDGPMTVSTSRRGGIVLKKKQGSLFASGVMYRVPWAAKAAAAVGFADLNGEKYVLSIPLGQCTISPGRNIAGEPRDTVSLDEIPLGKDMIAEVAYDTGLQDTLLRRGALARSLMIAGALEQIADMTLAYSQTRHQFGKPIAAFQAVQQHLVRLYSEAEGAGMAARIALGRYKDGGADFEIACAKAATSHAAGIVAGLAHQVHGAIGVTEEYNLHYFTRRLWSWRAEFGSEAYWNRRVGAQISDVGADGLWTLIATQLLETA
ncbi:MAG: acyl-CoA dehydrogenase family protein [Ferrimicrobium sp.]